MIKDSVFYLTDGFKEPKSYDYNLDVGAFLKINLDEPLEEQLNKDNLVVVSIEKVKDENNKELSRFKVRNKRESSFFKKRLQYIFTKNYLVTGIQADKSFNLLSSSFSFKDLSPLISREIEEEMAKFNISHKEHPFPKDKFNANLKPIYTKYDDNKGLIFSEKMGYYSKETILGILNKNSKDMSKLPDSDYQWLISEERESILNKITNYFEENKEVFSEDLYTFIFNNVVERKDNKESVTYSMIKGLNNSNYLTISFDLDLEYYRKESNLMKSFNKLKTSNSLKSIVTSNGEETVSYAITEMKSYDPKKNFNKNIDNTSRSDMFTNMNNDSEVMIENFLDYLSYNYKQLQSIKGYFGTESINGLICRQLLINYNGEINNKSEAGIIISFNKAKSGMSFLRKEFHNPLTKNPLTFKYKKIVPLFNENQKKIGKTEKVIVINGVSELYNELNKLFFSNAMKWSIEDLSKSYHKKELFVYIKKYKEIFSMVKTERQTKSIITESLATDFNQILKIYSEDIYRHGFGTTVGSGSPVYKTPYSDDIENMISFMKSLGSTPKNREEDIIMLKKDVIYDRYKKREPLIRTRSEFMFVMGNVTKIIANLSQSETANLKVSSRVSNQPKISKMIDVIQEFYSKYIPLSENKNIIISLIHELLTFMYEEELEDKVSASDRNSFFYGNMSDSLMYVKKDEIITEEK